MLVVARAHPGVMRLLSSLDTQTYQRMEIGRTTSGVLLVRPTIMCRASEGGAKGEDENELETDTLNNDRIR